MGTEIVDEAYGTIIQTSKKIGAIEEYIRIFRTMRDLMTEKYNKSEFIEFRHELIERLKGDK